MSKTPEPQPNPYLMPQGAYPEYMQQPSHHSDEIDLFELVGTLWHKKLIIIAVMCITTLLAGAYAFTAKEQWTAKAYLQAPRVADMGNYLDLRRAYARILGNSVDTGALAGGLFSDLMLLAQSPDEKIAFLKQSDYFKQLESTLSTPLAKQEWLNKAAESALVITPPDAKNAVSYYTVSMSADSAVEAKRLLTSYITDINKKSVELDNYEFDNTVSALMLNFKKEMIDIAFKQQTDRDNQIKDLTHELQTAKIAGYTEFRNFNKSSIEVAQNVYKYMLGEKILTAELDSLKSSPVVYPYRYYQLEQKLQQLAPLVSEAVNARAYRYQMMPTDPITKDKPKRALILVLGALLGGMLGVAGVLVQSAIGQRRTRETESV